MFPGINEVDNAEYLAEFCKTFESAIVRQIEQNMRESSAIEHDNLFSEVSYLYSTKERYGY